MSQWVCQSGQTYFLDENWCHHIEFKGNAASVVFTEEVYHNNSEHHMLFNCKITNFLTFKFRHCQMLTFTTFRWKSLFLWNLFGGDVWDISSSVNFGLHWNISIVISSSRISRVSGSSGKCRSVWRWTAMQLTHFILAHEKII